MDKSCFQILKLLKKQSLNYYEINILLNFEFSTTMQKVQYLVKEKYLYEETNLSSAPSKFSITQKGLNFIAEKNDHKKDILLPCIISILTTLITNYLTHIFIK